MVKSAYCNYCFVIILLSFIDITIVELLVTNYKNTICKKSFIKKEESVISVFE